jgi:hypothetical protein
MNFIWLVYFLRMIIFFTNEDALINLSTNISINIFFSSSNGSNDGSKTDNNRGSELSIHPLSLTIRDRKLKFSCKVDLDV